MFFQIKSYFQFLLHSSNQHGVHSPFVYHLITKCIYTKTTKDKIQKIEQYRAELPTNLSKVTSLSKKRSLLLIRLVDYLNLNSILEIGTSSGIGTASMVLGNPKSNLITLSDSPETSKTIQNQFEKFNFNSIDMVIGEYHKTLPKIATNTFDFIYFGRNDKNKSTLDYFEQCISKTHNDSVCIIEGIHSSKEMSETWEIIKNNPKATVTIDTFQWGFVFFRREQLKEHFTIRV